MHKVMLIEDDRTMLSLLSTLLGMEGFQVVTAGDESVEIIHQALKTEQPATVLLDVNLRHLNGLDVLRDIRQDPEMDFVRVIMSSGIDYREQCIEAGAQDFILKPYMPDDLIKKIRRSLDD
jgi:DNA-binding response OmpR family regulator